MSDHDSDSVYATPRQETPSLSNSFTPESIDIFGTPLENLTNQEQYDETKTSLIDAIYVNQVFMFLEDFDNAVAQYAIKMFRQTLLRWEETRVISRGRGALNLLAGSRLSTSLPKRIRETVNGRERIYTVSESKNSSKRSFGKLEWVWADLEGVPGSVARHQARKLESFLHTMFLPVGYPQSVHPVYKLSHIWQFVETAIGSSMSVLCSQAMLSSVGLSPTPASSGSAAVAINWVLKDIIGEFLKLGFIQRFAKSFDSHPKSWKLVGEVCSLTGSLLQLTTALVSPHYFLLFAGLGFGLRSIHFSIWGATHMTFTRNFAQRGNVGDIVAKDDTQMAVAHLLGTAIGAGLLSFSHSTPILFTEFALFAPFHLYSTIALLNATRFPVLNQTNLSLICTEFVETHRVPNLNKVLPKTRFFNEWSIPGSRQPKVTIGASLHQAFQGRIGDLTLHESLEIFKADPKMKAYLIGYAAKKNRFFIVLHESATPQDVIQAMLLVTHASTCLSDEIPNHGMPHIIKKSVEYLKVHQDYFQTQLLDKGWDVDAVFWGDRGVRCHWSSSS